MLAAYYYFAGEIPAGIVQLTHLDYILVGDNRLSGEDVAKAVCLIYSYT